MAFYEDKREHYGGALVLFRRNLSVAVPNAKTHRPANWYMRLKIGGRKGYVTRSTKLTIYEDAYEYAKSELLRLQQAAKLGHSEPPPVCRRLQSKYGWSLWKKVTEQTGFQPRCAPARFG